VLEMMITQKGNGAKPLFGYNFDTLTSTGTVTATNSDSSNHHALGTTYALSGYTYGANMATSITNAVTGGTATLNAGDFAFEFMFLSMMAGESGNTSIFHIGTFKVQFTVTTQSPWYGRLIITTPDGLYYIINVLRSDLSTGWRHLAFVRSAGVLKVYLDGVEQQMTQSTTISYALGGIPYPYNLGNVSSLVWRDATTSAGFYITEFALYNYSKYTQNFTPKWPFV